jgi:hypothetical protein
MTHSTNVVRAKLVRRTDAVCSDEKVKNNKIHYRLKFENDIGWDWIEGQVQKTSEDVEIPLELWKIHTSGVCSFEIEVRELIRREGVTDDGQKELESFK